MFYKFDINGIYCGTSQTKDAYSTDVAVPADDSKTWVWNHYDWVGMPLGWKPIQVESIPVVEEAPVVEAPIEETPPTE